MNRHIYQYYAMYQSEPGKTVHIDGIYATEKKIISFDDYIKLKKSISEDNTNKLAVASLTYLGREND